MPVESLVFDHQHEYYQALQESSSQGDSAPFITFMLQMILDTLSAFTPKSPPKSPPKSGSCLRRFARR
jgi:Fic family protein